MSESQVKSASSPIPHPVSGIIDCPAELSFRDLISAIDKAGWSADGIQPEPEESTIAELLERRQPRPSHWGGGLLVDRCCRLSAGSETGHGYASIRAPRKASGPDFAFLFIGAERAFGAIERASISLVKPAPRYLKATGQIESVGELFAAARAISLLDPLSTRQLDWVSRELSAWVPVRAQNHEPLRAHLRSLGLSVTLAPDVPRAARFIAAPCLTPRLHLSGSYATITALLARADAERGRKRLDVAIRYLDCHGAHAILGTSKAGLPLLESLYEAILEAGEYDDVSLLDPDDGLRSPSIVVAFDGAGGET